MNIKEYIEAIEKTGLEVYQYENGIITSGEVILKESNVKENPEIKSKIEEEWKNLLAHISNNISFAYYGTQHTILKIHIMIGELNLSPGDWVLANEKGLINEYYNSSDYYDIFSQLQDTFCNFISEKIRDRSLSSQDIDLTIMDDIMISHLSIGDDWEFYRS